MKLHARLFDEKGRFLREDKGDVVAGWTEGDGERWLVHGGDEPVDQAGLIKATVGGLTGVGAGSRGASAAVDRELRIVYRGRAASGLGQCGGRDISR